MEYLSYYSECAGQIAVSFPPAEQYAFANLRQTCLSLPLEPLMNVAATIDCGPAGSDLAAGDSVPQPPTPPADAHASQDTSR